MIDHASAKRLVDFMLQAARQHIPNDAWMTLSNATTLGFDISSAPDGSWFHLQGDRIFIEWFDEEENICQIEIGEGRAAIV